MHSTQFCRHAGTARPRCRLAFFAYSKSSSVIDFGHSIFSSSGDQQGGPIGPLLFVLAVDLIANGVDSEQDVWHFDNALIGVFHELLLSDMQRSITGLKRIGLDVHPWKTEIINVGHAVGIFSCVVDSL